MCHGCCPCYKGNTKFKAYYCCSGGCATLTWGNWCCSLYSSDNEKRCVNCACLPITFLLTGLYLLLCLWQDFFNSLMWLICLGRCCQQCKCFCKTTEIEVEDGCPTMVEYSQLGEEIEREMQSMA